METTLSIYFLIFFSPKITVLYMAESEKRERDRSNGIFHGGISVGL